MQARSKEDAHRKDCPTKEVLDLIFSYQSERILSKNLETSFNNVIYQIKTHTKGYRLRHATVTVCEELNGLVTILHNGKKLDFTCHERAKHNAEIVDAKQLDAKIDSVKHAAKKYIPPANHPWRHYIVNPISTDIYAQTNPK